MTTDWKGEEFNDSHAYVEEDGEWVAAEDLDNYIDYRLINDPDFRESCVDLLNDHFRNEFAWKEVE